MYKNTLLTRRQRPWLPVFGVVALVVLALIFLWPQDQDQLAVHQQTSELYRPSASSTVPLQVSGVVTAADQAVIRAEMNGVVTALPLREGAAVSAGALVAVQAAPVAAAQLALADAQRGLVGTSQASAVSAAEYQAAVSQIAQASADEIAALHATANEAVVAEQADQLLTALSGAAVSMIATMDFIDANRSLFPVNDMDLYREVIESLYNRQPNFFTNGVLYPLDSPDDVLAQLDALQQAPVVDPAEVQQLAAVVESNLLSVSTLLASAERDVLDERVLDRSDARYSEYFTQRTNTLEQLAAIQQAYQGLRSTVSNTAEDHVGQTQSTETATAAAAQARAQAAFAVQIAAQQAAVAAAQQAIAQATLGLTRPTAPFAGVVSQVHAREGEFVTAGTPLVTIVGTGARELTVSVPTALVPLLAEGQVYTVAGVPVGYLDRFSTVGTGAGATAVITLTADTLPVGASVSGTLEATGAAAGVLSVPRPVVRFSAQGAYVLTERGDAVPVHIVYDAGAYLFIRTVTPLTEPLVPSAGLTF